ncbi:MAG TPA: hypothetical protein VFU86_07585 [Terriglobales bacterium]|nr:hypothetical protein [Terriglobales bacterium]
MMLQPNNIPIPAADPLPLPAPVWLLKTLLLVVFFLHLLFMNCTLAGGVTALFNAIRGRSHRHPLSRRLSAELGSVLPVFVAFTVTLGVAALLFVQVLYGNLFYTSSILIGAYWISVIVLVMLGYYGYYYYNSRSGERASTASIAVLGLAVLCFLAIGFIFTNNIALMWSPQKWLAMYRAHANGAQLNVGDRSIWPRYLHTIIGSFGVFTAALAEYGILRFKKDREYGGWLVRRASVVFAGTTVLQFLVGMWFLMALPKNVAMVFFRDGLGVSIFAVALLSTLAGTILLLVGSTATEPSPLIHAGFGMVLLTVALMVVMRDMVRTASLTPYFQLSRLQVSPQTGVIIVFLLTFAGGLATLVWILRKVVQGRSRSAAASAK